METTDNKMIIQSYSLTTIRNNFGLYSQRLIVRIAEAMQYRLEEADFTTKVVKYSDQRLHWQFNISSIMEKDSQNYTNIVNELRKIPQSVIHYNDGKKDVVMAVFSKLEYSNGQLDVYLTPFVWDLFIEFSRGYKRYQLRTALALKTSYSLRLYQLLSENAQPVTYTIDWLKRLFGVEEKYPKATNFILKVIEPAKKELEAKAEITFDYIAVTESKGRGRPVITALTFVTRKTRNVPNFDLEAKETDRKHGLQAVPPAIALRLKQDYGMTEKGLKANSRLIFEAYVAMKSPTLEDFLSEKREKAMKADNPQGWIINAIRGELETQ